MNAFFDSLKSDLFDRRLTPVLALLGAALLAAIVYAAIGGGSSSSTPAASAPVTVPKASGIAVTAAATTKTSVAETTSGAAEQTVGGATRNPFKPLPGVKSASTAATSASASGSTAAGTTSGSGSSGESSAGSSSEGSSSEGSSSGGSGSETNSQSGGTKQEKKASKPSKAYKVSILFGTAPAGTPVLSAGLTSYEDIRRQQPLPSATQPLIVFRGVVAGGKSATFTLVGEAILRGSAACLPSASQCQAIDLKEGDTEELEYVPLGGTSITYELHVVKIEAIKAKAGAVGKAAKAASVAEGIGGESKAGLQILREYGLMVVPGLRYSSDGSVLVFRGADHAFAARAHASAWGAASRG
jgi:hypothetical protein